MPGAATFFYSLVFCRIWGAVRIRRFTSTERRQAPDQGTRERMPVLSFPALEGRGLPRTWVNEPEHVERFQHLIVLVKKLERAVQPEHGLHALGILGNEGVD